MSKKKVVALSIIGILLVTIVTAGIFVNNLKTAGLPDYNRDIKLKDLSAPVKVVRDKRGFPHITAETESDLYQVTGYIMAQDRIWQMDLLRRVTMGKLSEIFGKSMVDADLLFRSLRISEKSRGLIQTSDPKIRKSVEAFAKGVNQYLSDNKDNLPFEFTVLGYRPEAWEPFHSLNLIGYMAWDLSSAWKSELLLQRIREKVGDDKLEDLVPDFMTDTPVYLEYQANRKLIDHLEKVMSTQNRIRNDLGLIPFRASNNWAVSGKKSVTGKAIFANDMHLSLFIPGIWYQVHQTVPGKLNVTGVALPGQPAVVAGHNNDIAWGMTNVMTDDLDFFLEKTDPSKPDQYLYKGEWRKFKVVKEEIAVKGEDPVIKEIRFTHRGPVVSELKSEKKQVISIQWLGNAESNEVRSVYLLNRARNWDDFKEALRSFVSISQNIAYADINGNIGLFNAGGVPIRSKGNGTEVGTGWTGEYEWQGLVPFEQKPFSYNPPSGIVSSANNKTVNKVFPYPISPWGFTTSHRIDRINQLLASKEKMFSDDFKAWQLDTMSSLSTELRPALSAIEANRSSLTKTELAAFETLKNWDGKAGSESRGVTIANTFFLTLVNVILKDEMGEAYFKKFSKVKMLNQQFFKQVMTQPDNKWIDDVRTADKKESYNDMMVTALKKSVAFLEEKIGENQEDWTWGTLHTLTLQHPVGKVAIINKLFNLNRGPYPMPGSYHTIPQFPYDHDKPFEIGHGPSQRHVFTPGDWDNSEAVIPTGISGIPGSPFYCDQTALYIKGDFHQDPFSPAAVEKAGKFRAVFSPR
jgi:penicillin G amidase